MQTVETDDGTQVLVAGTVRAELENADPATQQKAEDLSPVPGLTLTTLEWRRKDGAVDLTQPDLDALTGLSLSDFKKLDLGEVVVGARLSLNQLDDFDCGQGPQSTIDLGDGTLTLRPSGTVEGAISLNLPCEVSVGPFAATLTSTTLDFKGGSDGQRARLNAQAQLAVGEQTFTGSIGANLITGAITDLSFVLDKPFTWAIPQGNSPALTFRIDRAELSRDGLLVDGRQELLLAGQERGNASKQEERGASNLGVTFDELLLDIGSMRIASGSVLFDQGFAFQAGLIAGPPAADGSPGPEEMTLQAIPLSTEETPTFDAKTGVYFGLGGEIVLDKDGFRPRGEGKAIIRAGGFEFEEELVAIYGKDLSYSLYPDFTIGQGQIDFEWRGASVAYADAAGFHLNVDGLIETAIPDTLALPNDELAYIVLKTGPPEAQELLVDFVREATGGVRLTTKQPVALVLPALNDPLTPNAPAPQIMVTFQDLLITGGSVSAGFIEANTGGDARFDLSSRGIPMLIERIRYAGDAASSPDGIAGLNLNGFLSLFGRRRARKTRSTSASLRAVALRPTSTCARSAERSTWQVPNGRR